MDWQKFLEQINAEYKALGTADPQVEIYDGSTGDELNIVSIYTEDGIICIDTERPSSNIYD